MDTQARTLEVGKVAEGVAEIRLSRPEVLNRFDGALHADLTGVLRELARDSTVRAVVLSSTGKVFSAGGDFDLMRQAYKDGATRRAIVDEARELLAGFLDLPQPIVAAVQGSAVGLGATVALACDAVVAARSASLADTHVAVGLVAGDGGCLVWPASAGMLRARRHLLTGDPIDAETALRCGLVTDLVEAPNDAPRVARELAGKIADLAPLAVQGTKRALNRLAAQRAGEVVDLSLALEERTLASEDLLESIDAFAARRSPRFRGR